MTTSYAKPAVRVEPEPRCLRCGDPGQIETDTGSWCRADWLIVCLGGAMDPRDYRRLLYELMHLLAAKFAMHLIPLHGQPRKRKTGPPR